MKLPEHTMRILKKYVAPNEAYIRTKLKQDGYTPAKSLAALTVQFHNIYQKTFESILKKNPDAGFFKKMWNGIKKGFNSVKDVVVAGGSAILYGAAAGAGGQGAGTTNIHLPPQEEKDNTLLIVAALAAAILILR